MSTIDKRRAEVIVGVSKKFECEIVQLLKDTMFHNIVTLQKK